MLACEMSGGSVLGWGVGALFMLGFWGLLIAGAIYLIRNWIGSGSRADQELARRFAAGEMTEDEYRAGLATIRETRGERSSDV